MRKYIVHILDWNKMGAAAVAKLNTDTASVVRDAITARFYFEYRLEAESIGAVFEKLNIDHPADYFHRSMSVGDVVIDEETREVHVCLPVGWKKLL